LFRQSLLLLQEVHKALSGLPPAAAKVTGTPENGLAENLVSALGNGKLRPDHPPQGNTWDEETWEAALEPELADAVWMVTNLNVGVDTRVYLGNHTFGALATGMLACYCPRTEGSACLMDWSSLTLVQAHVTSKESHMATC
jgi:hypothetical protein